MKQSVLAYYRALSDGYDRKIRQLVPKYDEMTALVIDLVAGREPRAVLDIGCGTGTLAERLLERLPTASVTALDASHEMATHARRRLARFGPRAAVVEGDIADRAPEPAYDAVFSCLVLHNLEPDAKRHVLRSVGRLLTPRGTFVWADLVRQADPVAEANAVEYRRRFALAAGCDPELVRLNFDKEASVDAPLTVEEMVRAVEEIGLTACGVRWAHDTFAVLEFERGTA